jgi:hypothetical protein
VSSETGGRTEAGVLGGRVPARSRRFGGLANRRRSPVLQPGGREQDHEHFRADQVRRELPPDCSDGRAVALGSLRRSNKRSFTVALAIPCGGGVCRRRYSPSSATRRWIGWPRRAERPARALALIYDPRSNRKDRQVRMSDTRQNHDH